MASFGTSRSSKRFSIRNCFIIFFYLVYFFSFCFVFNQLKTKWGLNEKNASALNTSDYLMWGLRYPWYKVEEHCSASLCIALLRPAYSLHICDTLPVQNFLLLTIAVKKKKKVNMQIKIKLQRNKKHWLVFLISLDYYCFNHGYFFTFWLAFMYCVGNCSTEM